MKKLAIVGVAFALSACLQAPAPMISDYNGHTVKVIYHPYASADHPESPIWLAANEICQRDGRTASYQGVRRISEYQGEHTLLCL